MKRIVPAIVSVGLSLNLAAQTTGSMQGKVLDSKGKPVPDCKVVVSKVGINWKKDLKVSSEGKFFQVGFAPGVYDISISAPGFSEIKEQDRIGVGLVLQKDYVLLTPQEASKSDGVAIPTNPAAAAETQGLESFNQAVGFYNERNFSEALPLFEKACQALSDSITQSTDVVAKIELEKKLHAVQRPYSFSLVEVGKANEARRAELFLRAEPMLVKAVEMNPKDQNAIVYMLEITTSKNDAEGIKKYQDALDAILGPRPELAYNQGVELYNAGKLAEAKPFFLKSLEVKADFAEAYYLLAMCEFSENNLKGTKSNLQKYIELAPTGKHAAEVKAMLADPSLKNVK